MTAVWCCMDCDTTVELDRHGRCGACCSDAVVSMKPSGIIRSLCRAGSPVPEFEERLSGSRGHPTSEPEGAPTIVTAVVAPPRQSERRRRLRLIFSRPVRVGSEGESGYAEEVQGTVNVSRDGLYFTASLAHYYVGLSVQVTVPYSPVDPIKTERIGEVVRVEGLADGRVGIAVQFPSR